jgi:hypothetical protein
MNAQSKLNIKSVAATLKLLREVCTTPQKYIDVHELVEALRSQGKLANYQDPTRAIKPMSLNTFKSSAEEVGELKGGFVAIDKLRKEAAAAIEKTSVVLDPELIDSNAAKKRAINELHAQTMSLKATNQVFLRAIERVLLDLEDIADTTSASLRKRLKSESEERIHAALSVNSPPYDSVQTAAIKMTKS